MGGSVSRKGICLLGSLPPGGGGLPPGGVGAVGSPLLVLTSSSGQCSGQDASHWNALVFSVLCLFVLHCTDTIIQSYITKKNVITS